MVVALSERVNLGEGWQEVLGEELRQPYMEELALFVARERRGPEPIYPPADLVFNAFLQTPYERVKVVIVGQDPYHGPGQAHGLCFSVQPGVQTPPSLKNMYKEMHTDLGLPIPSQGSLLSWAQQGILLLNATLTVRQGQPKSHFGKGWERFTDAALAALLWTRVDSELQRHLLFNTILMASVSTLVFNANPLMRFDGYYILADLLEIPNLATEGM